MSVSSVFARTLLFIACAICLLMDGACAQGLFNFANGAAGVNAPVRDATQPNQPLVSGTNWLAQAYFAPGIVSDPRLLTTNGIIGGGPVPFLTSPGAGYFLGGAREIEGYCADNVTIQVRTWLATSGVNWETAIVRGESNLVPVPLACDLPIRNLVGLQPWANYAVPEPSVGLLALCGLAVVFLRKRR